LIFPASSGMIGYAKIKDKTMQKLHELIAIIDELLAKEYRLGEHVLSHMYDECIDQEALTFDVAYNELVNKIIHTGLLHDFGYYEELEETIDNGVVTIGPISHESISIYDKEQFDKFTCGMPDSFKHLIKELDTPTEHWVVLSVYDG